MYYSVTRLLQKNKALRWWLAFVIMLAITITVFTANYYKRQVSNTEEHYEQELKETKNGLKHYYQSEIMVLKDDKEKLEDENEILKGQIKGENK